MIPFLSKVNEDLQQIQKNQKTAEEYFSDLVTYWGENPKEMGPDAFFGIWTRFSDALVAAAEANKEAKINAEKIRKREESKQQRNEELEKKRKQVSEAQGTDQLVNELFGALQGGNLFKNRRQEKGNTSAIPKPEDKKAPINFKANLKKTEGPQINKSESLPPVKKTELKPVKK